ncbi:hypothetical protein H5202_15840 [Shewanella sp. SG41-4]|uniref:hypothetical protein n=1 Tax=Shewanella sp. SG41-4 TaxID=2760976 RepID=UPI001603762E|nr:hypothetical protein [Shewanella sp. SG41-4]MBB1440119.1 hypothetical protein [Shewanella sp. SG41-4]
MSLADKLKRINETIVALEDLKENSIKVIDDMQQSDAYDPSVSVEDDFESVIDILNRFQEHIKYTQM